MYRNLRLAVLNESGVVIAEAILRSPDNCSHQPPEVCGNMECVPEVVTGWSIDYLHDPYDERGV